MSAYAYAERAFFNAVAGEPMSQHLSGGALLALSGGKDSVLLFTLFSAYAKRKNIPFAAFHLHHGIRGEEADRDADFCRVLCEKAGVPLIVEYADVPALAKAAGEGIEEAARHERYARMSRYMREQGYTALLTAHTAGDVAETVLLHLCRGGGGNALCGIPPVRPLAEGMAVLRPLLSLRPDEVRAALAERGISYVSDTTNRDIGYHRNYVREEILPRLRQLAPAPEDAILRMCENLRPDMAYLDTLADGEYGKLSNEDNTLCASLFYALPAPLRYRVLCRFYAERCPDAPRLCRVHTDAILARMAKEGDFALSLPAGGVLRRMGDRLSIAADGGCEDFDHGITPVFMGMNCLSDGSILWLTEEKNITPFPNLHTFIIQRTLASATIEGELYVRSRREGDAYRYGGHTHKIKKLFSDRKIPREQRTHIPLLCDGRGILWVPGFGVREDGEKSGTLYGSYLPAEYVPSDLRKERFPKE